MAKTLTLSNTTMQSIQLNRTQEIDGTISGIASALNYVVTDADGNEVMYKTSVKYTSGTSFSDDDKMSSDAETKLNAYWDAMVALMKEREEL
jgi:hypothetical protein